MAILGTIGVKLTAQTAEFAKGMGDASKQLESFSKKSANIAKKSAVAFAALSGASFAVTKAYGIQQSAELRLQSAFKATGKALDLKRFKTFASELQKVSTFGDEATIATGALLSTFGMTQDQMERLIPVVADFASARQIDLKTAADLVGKAFAGQTGTLSRYGIVLDDSTRKILQNGDATQKTAILAEELSKKFAGQAKVATQTATGAMVQLKNAFGDVLESMGEVLDAPAAATFHSIRKVLESLSPTMKKAAGIILQVGVAVTGTVTAVAALVALFPAIKAGFLLAAKGATVFMTTILPVIVIIGSLIAIIGALRLAWVGDLGGMRTSTINFVANVKYEFNELVKTVSDMLDRLGEVFTTFTSMLLGESPEEAFNRSRERKRSIRESVSAPKAATGPGVLSQGKDILVNVGTSIKESFTSGLMALGIFSDEVTKTAKKVADQGDAAQKASKGLSAAALALKEKLGKQTFGGMANAFRDLRIEAENAAGSIPTMMETISASVEAGLQNMFESLTPAVGANVSRALTGAMETAFSLAVPAIQSAGQYMSAAIQGAAEGFKSGGVWGAVIGALLALVMQTESFKEILAIGNNSLGFVVKLLNRFMKPLVPIIEVLTSLAALLIDLTSTTSGMGTAVEVLGKVFGGIAKVIHTIIKGVADAFNWVLRKIAKAISKIPGVGKKWAKGIRNSQIQIEEFGKQVVDTAPAADNLDKTNEAITELSEQLLNVPTGFKVALRRFQAIDPAMGDVPGGIDTSVEAQKQVNIEQIILAPPDAETFLTYLEESEQFKQFVESGSSESTPTLSDYAFPRKGYL